MSIELIAENHGDEIKDLLLSSKDNLYIISPFMGMSTCKELSNIITANKLNCKIITRFYRENFFQNVSSIDGLLLLLKSGAELMALKYLHTKLYIFDDNCSIITSANFTSNGFYANYELGLKIDDEFEIIQKCIDYFDDLWEKINEYNKEHNNEAIITEKILEEEKAIINKISSQRTTSTENWNNIMRGAEINIKPTQNVDIMEKAFSLLSDKSIDMSDGGWLKFTSGSRERHNPEKDYLYAENEFTLEHTFFPKKPTGVKKGEKMYLAAVSRDSDGIDTPIIMARCIAEGFNKDNIIIKGNFGHWMDWMADYPYYVECRNIEVIKGPVKNGVSLLEAYRVLKGNIYPSQLNSNISFEKIKRFHHQKDKIRITKIASEYFDNELEKRFSEYGKEIYN